MKKILLFYAAGALTVSVLFYSYLHRQLEQNIDTVAQKQLEILQKTYKAVVTTRVKTAKKEYEYFVKENEKVMSLMRQVSLADESHYPYLRGLLFSLLYEHYQELKAQGLRQLHFHLPDGRSFLRFHAPYLNGDALADVRKSIKIANSKRTEVHGFEGGRVFAGFRNVFAITGQDRHYGSVEFSQPFETIATDLEKIVDTYSLHLLQSRSDTVDIVKKEFKDYFVPSNICDKFVIENPNISPMTRKLREDKLIQKINDRLSVCKNLDAALKAGQNYARPVVVDGKGYLVNFVHISGVDADTSAYLVSYERFKQLPGLQSRYKMFSLLGTAAIVFVFASGFLLHRRRREVDAANARIKTQAQFTQTIMQNAPVAMYYKNTRGVYMDCNDAFVKLLGRAKRSQIIGKQPYEIAPYDIASLYEKHDTQLFDKSSSHRVYEDAIYDMQTKRIKNVVFHKTAYYNKDGQVEGIIGAIADMSDFYANLRQKQKFYNASQYSPAIIVMTDTQGIIEYVNPAFCSVTGYSKEEIIGTSAYDLGDADSAAIMRDLQEYDLWEGEVENSTKEGTTYIQKTKITPYYDEKNILSGYLSVGEDITRLKELEKIRQDYTKELESRVQSKLSELRSKDKMLIQQSKMAAMGEMIGNIAHQWRQPLNALYINIQLLEDDYEDGEIDKNYIDDFIYKTSKSIKYMDKTIDDFRNFFRPDKAKKRFDIKKAIDDTIDLVGAGYKNAGIAIQKELTAKECDILGYESEFKQVLVNIMKNAKDQLQNNRVQDGRVRIILERNERITLSIIDNAGGIDEEVLPKVFDPYFTTKEDSGGTGIGLYMSKMIIEQSMNGQISLENHGRGVLTKIIL